MSDSSTSVTIGQIAAVASPFVAAVIAVLIRSALAAAVAELKTLTGIQVQQAAIDKIDDLAASGANAAVAAEEGNLASVAIPLGSPIVTRIVDDILAKAPGDLAAAGVTPAALGTLVQGKLGAIQASMTVAVPATVKA